MFKNPYRVVPIADSFVLPSNKLVTSTGNGEAKLYVGQRSDYKVSTFWGTPGNSIEVVFLRDDLEKFLSREVHKINENSSFWREGNRLTSLYGERKEQLLSLPQIIFVNLVDDVSVGGPRRYFRPNAATLSGSNFNSDDNAKRYNLIFRALPLSGTSSSASCLVFEKVSDGKYRAGFLIGTGDEVRGMIERADGDVEEARINEDRTIPPTTRRSLIDSRIGQGDFKDALRRLDGAHCALTGVSNQRLLIASHIKSWSQSSDSERLDPHNGLLLSPDADKLFDLGLISFTADGFMIVSPQLSNDDLEKCGISKSMRLSVVINEPRAQYLAIHRKKFGFD